MPADLVTRLLLKNDEFDRKLKASKSQVADFDKKVGAGTSSVKQFSSNLSTGAVAGMTKFAGAIGIAVSAGETLNKYMQSSQTTSDLLANKLNAARDSVDAFFVALNTGDFSAFNEGLIGLYTKAENLSAMFDVLADKKLSLSYINAEDLKDIERFEQIAKDTNRSMADRINAAQNMTGVVNHLNKSVRETADLTKKTLTESLNVKFGYKFNFEDIEYFIKNTNFSEKLTADAQEARKELVRLEKAANKAKKSAVYDRNTYGYDPNRKYQKEYKIAQSEYEVFKKENEFLIKQGVLAEDVDENRQKMVETLKEQLVTEREIYSLQKRADKTRRALNEKNSALTDNLKSKKVEIPIKLGSEKDIENQIKELSEKVQNEVDLDVKFDLLKKVGELKRQLEEIRKRNKLIIDVEYKTEPIKAPGAPEGKKPSDKLDEYSSELKDKYLLNIGNEKQKYEERQELYNKELKSIEDVKTAIGSINGAFQSFSGSLGENATKWFDWAANIAGAIASVIPLMKTLTNANKAVAISGAAASASSVPVTGWITAIGAVASIAGLLANLPSFEKGGVVPGASYTGDKVLIRANSGEMVLTRNQQSHLSRMLNVPGISKKEDITLHMVAKGSDLVAVFDNYDRKQARIKG